MSLECQIIARGVPTIFKLVGEWDEPVNPLPVGVPLVNKYNDAFSFYVKPTNAHVYKHFPGELWFLRHSPTDLRFLADTGSVVNLMRQEDMNRNFPVAIVIIQEQLPTIYPSVPLQIVKSWEAILFTLYGYTILNNTVIIEPASLTHDIKDCNIQDAVKSTKTEWYNCYPSTLKIDSNCLKRVAGNKNSITPVGGLAIKLAFFDHVHYDPARNHPDLPLKIIRSQGSGTGPARFHDRQKR